VRQREKREPAAERQFDFQAWRREADRIVGTDQNGGPVREPGEPVIGGQFMIRPAPDKPGSEHQRCRDPRKAFLEIRAVLLFDPRDPVLAQDCQRFRAHGIKITDHALGKNPRRNQPIGAAVGGYEPACHRCAALERRFAVLAPADQKNWFR